MTALDCATPSTLVYFPTHMTTPIGDADPLEALLEGSDDDENDRELDLAMSIIHDLDVSLLEPQSPTPSSCSTSSIDHDDLQSTDFNASRRASGLSYGVGTDSLMLAEASGDWYAFSLSATAAAQPPAFAPMAAAKPKRKEKKCTYQNRRVRAFLHEHVHISELSSYALL